MAEQHKLLRKLRPRAPLRSRREDIIPIAEHYAGYYARKYNRPAKPISAETAEALRQYDWPGNVRALRHAVERAVILSEGEQFEPWDFPMSSEAPVREPADDIDSLNLENIERHAIQRALSRNRYNISHAAKDLGLTRAALYRRMEKHGL